MSHPRGKVFLVGGGPGDPDLLTLRGAQCLASADVVLYDYLINPNVLAHARESAELICVGRHGRDRILSQNEINALMVEHAQAGRQVVRLKGGDPIVFARIAEEIASLEAAGLAYEIVPGITSALAVGSYAGIPLTQGDTASAVALVTGHERDDKPQALDYAGLARFPGTLVFYMGITTAEHWAAALVAEGKSAETPVAIVRRVSMPDQQTIRCTLATVAAEIKQHKLRPPALIIVGDVARAATLHDWFSARPLFGKRVLVTRAAHQAPELVTKLSSLGADVLVQPAIEIGPPDDWTPVDHAIKRLPSLDWLVFSSSNGVRSFLDRLLQTRDLRALAGLRIAAIGPGSAEELARYHLRADVVPEEYRAEALADSLKSEAARGARFLLIRASRGREVLAEQLAGQGGHVEQVVVYTSRDVAAAEPEVLSQLADGKIDWVTVTSSAIARSVVRLLGEGLRRTRLVSISPITSAALSELGHEVSAEANPYTMAGLVAALLAAEGK
jgi:uroporphyrinogen III methyltransferase/synthase